MEGWEMNKPSRNGGTKVAKIESFVVERGHTNRSRVFLRVQATWTKDRRKARQFGTLTEAYLSLGANAGRVVKV
jgi:hypothetical protein